MEKKKKAMILNKGVGVGLMGKVVLFSHRLEGREGVIQIARGRTFQKEGEPERLVFR